MADSDLKWALEDLARDVDLLVFRLERPPEPSAEDERRELRRRLEELHEQLTDLAQRS